MRIETSRLTSTRADGSQHLFGPRQFLAYHMCGLIGVLGVFPAVFTNKLHKQVCVCVYVYVCVCMYVCMCVYVCVCRTSLSDLSATHWV